jgi:hypothetical protein
MTVPEVFIMQAWEKAGGQCDCRRLSHSHTYARCTLRLVYENRGSRVKGGWVPRFRTSPTSNTPLACEILCLECYEQAQIDDFKHKE